MGIATVRSRESKQRTAPVRAKVPPDQFQIFDLYTLKGLPVGEVARLTRSSRARVYMVKHRLSGMIRLLKPLGNSA